MNLTFDQLPQQVVFLTKEIAELKRLMTEKDKPDPLPEWLNMDQLINYLPSKPARQTIYGLVNRKKIPCHRINNRLFFDRKEIDQWLEGKRKFTKADIQAQADAFLNNRGTA